MQYTLVSKVCENIKTVRREFGSYKVVVWLDKCGDVRTVTVAVSYRSIIDPMLHMVITDNSPKLKRLSNDELLVAATERLKEIFAGSFDLIVSAVSDAKSGGKAEQSN